MPGFKIRELMVNVLPRDGWRMQVPTECPEGGSHVNTVPIDPCAPCTYVGSHVNTDPVRPCGTCTFTATTADPCGTCTTTPSVPPIPPEAPVPAANFYLLMAQMKQALDADRGLPLH